MHTDGVSKVFERRVPGAFRFGRDGNIAPLFALLLAVLLGSMALSFDLGRAYDLQTEMQSAADAAALAAGTQLDNTASARNRACIAAVGTATNCDSNADMTLDPAVALVRNTQSFSTDGAGANVATFRVKFFRTLTKDVSGNLNDPATSDTDAEFVEVVARPRGMQFWLAGVVGALSTVQVQGRAVAGLGTAYCQVPPMFVCQPGGGFTAAHVGIGVWAKSKGGAGAWGPGNFGMLALPGHTLSAAEISEALASVNPAAACYGPIGTETKPGSMTNQAAWGVNTRFDIYEGYARDDPQYQPSKNTTKGLLVGTSGAASNRCKMTTNNNGWHAPAVANRWLGPADTTGDVMGLPRDNCAYSTDPAVGGTGACRPASADNGAFGTTNVGDYWAYDHYMAITHPTNAPADKTAAIALMDPVANGGNGNGLLSRWEVYKWEMANAANNETNTLEIGQPIGSAADHCYQDGAGPVPDTAVVPPTDRRLLCIAAVDCSAFPPTGNTSVTVAQWIGFFLTEPAGYEWSNETADLQTIYGEIVGPTAECSGPDAIVARQTVQLFE